MSMPLEHRVKELERKLATVTQERDDLLKDVEALAISNGSSMFSSSYVLSERVSAVDQVSGILIMHGELGNLARHGDFHE